MNGKKNRETLSISLPDVSFLSQEGIALTPGARLPTLRLEMTSGKRSCKGRSPKANARSHHLRALSLRDAATERARSVEAIPL